MFTFSPRRQSRRVSLTPMIDVVFLLLVFFMLAARFGQDFSLPLSTTSGESAYDGPPRLIAVSGETVLLNGQTLTLEEIVARLPSLTNTADDTIFVHPDDATNLQHLVDVFDALRSAGFNAISLVGAP